MKMNVLSLIGDPGIDEVVKNVCKEVHYEIACGDDQDASLDQRVVPCLDRLDGKAPNTWPGEYSLRDDRAGEERAKLEAHNRNDGEEGVAQRVFQSNPPFVESFGSGSLDVIFVHRLQEARAYHPGKDRRHYHA